jgi:endonuclease YncB( thermonuclease family)
MIKIGKLLLLILLIGLAVYVQALEQSKASGIRVLRVIDGDTVEIEADYLPPELGKKLLVRILGVDTPEKGFRAHCKDENLLSLKAKLFTEQLIRNATQIELKMKSWDKYGGRVLGDIIIDGKSLSETLIKSKFAVPYNGEKKTYDWCNHKH